MESFTPGTKAPKWLKGPIIDTNRDWRIFYRNIFEEYIRCNLRYQHGINNIWNIFRLNIFEELARFAPHDGSGDEIWIYLKTWTYLANKYDWQTHIFDKQINQKIWIIWRHEILGTQIYHIWHLHTCYLSFYLHKHNFWINFFSTQKRVNRDKVGFGPIHCK